MDSQRPPPSAHGEEPGGRRAFLSSASSWFMAGGLAAGYGAFGAVAGRYLYPARGRPLRWLLVARVADLRPGSQVVYRAPSGERIAVARTGPREAVEDFVALSSTCPHLGCQVHWEATHDRFFCPCHNGTFDRGGKGTGGPPGEAGLSLLRYPLKLEGGLLYIQVPVERPPGAEVAEAGTLEDPPEHRGPGHDPCLDRGARPRTA